MSFENFAIATVNTYLESFGKKDLDAIMDLYAEDAWIEDPVGTERKVGHAAIRDFYQIGIDMGAVGTLESEVRVAANEVAFAFRMEVDTGSGILVISPIDVMTFNEDGKITSMRAFFGPANQTMKE